MHLLDIRQLAMIVSVSEHGGLSPAARALGLTPSALSHRLAEAERRLGFELFARGGRSLAITPAGLHLLDAAQRVQATLAQAQREATHVARGFDRAIRVGSRAYGAYRWLSRFLRETPEPRTLVEIVDDGSDSSLAALRDGRIDIAIAAGRLAGRGVELHPLFRDELLALMPPGHPCRNKPFLVAHEFLDSVYVTYSVQAEPGHEYERFFLQAGVTPAQILRAGLTDAVVEFVRQGMGMTILSAWAARDALAAGHVVGRPVTQEGLTLDWYAVIRNDEPPGSGVRRFVEQLALWAADNPHVVGYRRCAEPIPTIGAFVEQASAAPEPDR